MAIPTNVQSAMTAADAAVSDAEQKSAALTSATQARAAAESSEQEAQQAADAAVKSLSDRKADLTAAIDAWLDLPAPAAASAGNAAHAGDAHVTSTIVTASTDAQPAK